jgi:hypothetical protein
MSLLEKWKERLSKNVIESLGEKIKKEFTVLEMESEITGEKIEIFILQKEKEKLMTFFQNIEKKALKK